MRKRLPLFPPWPGKKLPQEKRLHRDSPVRLWLTRRRERPETASAQDLLGALADPTADWADRAVGYAALGEIDLSPTERVHAHQILFQGLRHSRQHDLPTRLGYALFHSLLPGVILGVAAPLCVSLLFDSIDPFPDCPLEILALLGITASPWLTFVQREWRERRRVGLVQRSAVGTLARIEDATCLRPGPASALLSDLSIPIQKLEARAQGLLTLCEHDLSPSEQRQASQLLAAALRLSGASNPLSRRAARAAGMAMLSGVAIVGVSFPFLLSGVMPVGRGSLSQILRELIPLLGYTFGSIGLFTVLMGPLCFLLLNLIEPKRLRRLHRAAVTAAERIGGPECIPALDEHIVFETPLRKDALNALRHVLPRVTEEWYGRLPAEVTPILLKMAESSNPSIACLAIDAIGRAGGGNCLEPIALRAIRTLVTEIRAHANTVLPILQQRRDRESSASTLLRASQPTTAEHLLKPVYGTEADTSNLLRASSGSD